MDSSTSLYTEKEELDSNPNLCDGEFEKSDTDSVGKLQHDIKMLKIQLLERDMEIKNLRLECQSLKGLGEIKRLRGTFHLNPDDVCPPTSISYEKSAYSEVDALRRFLMNHDFHDSSQLFLSTDQYDSLKKQPLGELDLLSLVRLRHFQLVAHLKETFNNLQKIERTKEDHGCQTEEVFVNEDPDQCLNRQIQLLKHNNEYLQNHNSTLVEKIGVLEKEKAEIGNEFLKSESERTILLSRAMAAEKEMQILRDQLKSKHQSSENVVPNHLLEQLWIPEECRRQKEMSNAMDQLKSAPAKHEALQQRLQAAESELTNLREQPQMTSSSVGPFGLQGSTLAKAQILRLQVQLNAAYSSRDEALALAELMKEKFETTSRALTELDAARKVEAAQAESRLAMASYKLAMYERLESELDRAIETAADDSGAALRALIFLKDENGIDKGPPLLPTLASRRLEHCIKLSRKLVECQRKQRSLSEENQRLRAELETQRSENQRLSTQLASANLPASGLATVLVARDARISELEVAKRGLEEKLKRLYTCTKNILAERNAMIADLKEACFAVNLEEPTKEKAKKINTISKYRPSRKVSRTQT